MAKTQKSKTATFQRATKNSQRKKTIWRWSIGIALVVIFGIFIGFLNHSQSQKAEEREKSQQEEIASLPENKPDLISSTGSFAIGQDGTPIEPSEARTDVPRVEFIFDLHCPGCHMVDTALNESLVDHVKDGSIQLWLTPVAFTASHSTDYYSDRAASALVTVAQDQPEKLLPFMAKLYQEFPDSGPSYEPVSYETIGSWAQEVGVSAEVADSFSEQKYRWFATENVEVQKNRLEIFPAGEMTTPTILIGGSQDDMGVLEDFYRVSFSDSDVVGTFSKAFEEATGQSW